MSKRFVIMLFCGLMTLNCSSQAIITFKEKSHNFGTFLESKGKLVHTFIFKNTGNKPLIIHQVITSCGCAIPSYTLTPTAPGKSGKLLITYNGKGKFPGHFKKVITVRTNTKNKVTRLFIEGNMIIDKKNKKD